MWKKLLSNPYNLIILLLVGYILFLQFCNSVPKSNCPEVTTTVQRFTKTDTIYLEKKPTTTKVPIDKEPKVVGTVKVDSLAKDSILQVREYSNNIEDSLLTGIITARVTGTLDELSLTYIPKFPKYITKLDSVVTTNTIEIYKPRRGIAFGFEVSINKDINLDFSPVLEYKDKKGFQYGARYSVLSKSIGLRLTKEFSIGK